MPLTQQKNVPKQKQTSVDRKRILKIKQTILKIVEGMLEEEISEKWFLENCQKLCQNDYNDVIQERSIEHLCGYPLCSKPLIQIAKQKYHISSTNNKVYDLSERKCFCSNECYKASNFIKHQLSPFPLYMRKESSITINLISEEENKGSVGEEIVLQEVVSEKEIENAPCIPISTRHLSNILQEEIKNCTDSLEGLQIKEKIYEKPYVFEGKPKESKHESLIDSDEDEHHTNEDSDEDKNIFPEHENDAFLNQKHMPVPIKVKKAVLITPFKPCDRTIGTPSEISSEFIRKVFRDWMTEDTMKYLLGEREFYAAKADMLFHSTVESDPKNAEKLNCTKNDYIDLCLKVDKLPDDDCFEVECHTSDSLLLKAEKSSTINVKTASVETKCPLEIQSGTCGISSEHISEKSSKAVDDHKQEKNKPKKKSKSKFKGVTFAPDTKDSNHTAKESENICNVSNDFNKELNDSTPDPVLPLVDSFSQSALRRQVVIGKLKTVFYDVLPFANLHYTDIRDSVKDLLDTFSLSPTNIIFKPKEWKIIAVFLFRVLTIRVLKNLYEETKFRKLFQDLEVSQIMRIEEFENIAKEMTSARQLQNLQNC